MVNQENGEEETYTKKRQEEWRWSSHVWSYPALCFLWAFPENRWWFHRCMSIIPRICYLFIHIPRICHPLFCFLELLFLAVKMKKGWKWRFFNEIMSIFWFKIILFLYICLFSLCNSSRPMKTCGVRGGAVGFACEFVVWWVFFHLQLNHISRWDPFSS